MLCALARPPSKTPGPNAKLAAEAAAARLTALRGVGPWTAQLYLLSCLGHDDAWPPGDIALEEAARLDGANRWQIFWKVFIPLSRPALVTLAMLSFLTNYNDFLWPVYVLFSPEIQTLPAGLSTLQTANAVRYDLLMAGAVVASVPVLAIYLGAQRFIFEGVSRSGLKG